MEKMLIVILFLNSFFSAFAQENIEIKKEESKKVTISCNKKSSLDIRIDELSDLILIGADDVQVKDFKLKMPGTPTYSVNGNKLTDTIIRKLKGLKKEKSFMIFSANICPGDVHGSKVVFFTIK